MSASVARQLALGAAALALAGMGTLTACGKPSEEKPASPSRTSTASSLSPTEKAVPGAITPGPNAGTPPGATGRPAPTAIPHHGG